MIRFIPNILSILRIILIPFILILVSNNSYFFAFCLSLLASLTDLFDGFFARLLNSETKLGFYLDTIADKFFIFSIYLMIGIKLLLPIYIVVIIIFRDIIISISYIILVSMKKKLNLKPSKISKINTFMQMFLIVIILLNLNHTNILFFENEILINYLSFVVIFTTLLSLAIYINNWLKEQLA